LIHLSGIEGRRTTVLSDSSIDSEEEFTTVIGEEVWRVVVLEEVGSSSNLKRRECREQLVEEVLIK